MSMFGSFWQWMKRTYAALLVFFATPLVKVSRYLLGIADKLLPVVQPEPVVEVASAPFVEENDFLANAFKAVEQIPQPKSLQEQLEDYFAMKADSCSPAVTKIIDKYLEDKHGKALGYENAYNKRIRAHQTAMQNLLNSGERAGILKRVQPKQYSIDAIFNLAGFHVDAATEGSAETNALMTEVTGMDQPFPTPYDVKYFEPNDDMASIRMHESIKKRLMDIDTKLRNEKKLPKGWGRNSVIVASAQMHIDELLRERAEAEKERAAAEKPMESIDAKLRDAKNLPKNLRTHAARNALMVEEKTKKSKPKPKTKKAARTSASRKSK